MGVRNIINDLYDRGQSIWCDNISRHMIASGGLQRYIDQGIVGVTSNPTIFMKAITGGHDYDKLFQSLLADTSDVMDLYEGLVLPDIADAADLLRPVHDRTDGVDGFVSIEVNPKLAYDTDATVEQGRRLFKQLNRPNVMIKVPATDDGIPAIETLIAEGVNVNVTLIFSRRMHRKVMDAYLKGLRILHDKGGDLGKVSSVASFFVSRVDGAVDKILEEKRAAGQSTDHLMGKAAIANAKLAYADFVQTFSTSGSFSELAKAGARVQRPLWASTSTKNPSYPDTMYCDGLVGANTVNTLPPATIETVTDHGQTKDVIATGLDEARGVMDSLAAMGIDIDKVTDQLLIDGVDSFTQSFEELLENLNGKRQELKIAG